MCKFCEEIEGLKKRHKLTSEAGTDAEIAKLGKYMQELTIAVVERTWYQKSEKKRSSRTVHFRNDGVGYDFHFCPECGKKLRGQ